MEYYIYELIDPRNSIPFYIGKGSKKRAQSHFWPSSKGENPYKDNKINKLISLGYNRKDIIKYLFTSNDENKILKIEEYLIDINMKDLTNMIRGGTQPPKRYGKDNNFYGGVSKEISKKSYISLMKTINSKTPEQRSKETGGKPFIAISPDGIEYKGFNQIEFGKKYNLSAKSINSCLKGKRKHHKGWTFKFIG